MKVPTKYKRQVEAISTFKEAFKAYSALDGKAHHSPTELDRILALREKLNMMLGEVATYVKESGASTVLRYIPPPVIGGPTLDVDLFANLFRLCQFSFSPQAVIDALENAQGNYEFLETQFWNRLVKGVVNPLRWVGEVIRLPFHLASWAGFNSAKLELHVLGKLYKFTASLAAFGWVVVQILNYFGVNVAKLFSR